MVVRVEERQGEWWVVIEEGGESHKEAFSEKAQAEECAAAVRKKYGLFTFADYLKIWRADYATELSKQTLTRYESLLKVHISPRFSGMAMDGIDRAEMKRFITGKRDAGDLARNTLQQIVNLLSGIFRHAIRDGNAKENPCSGLIGELLKSKDKAKQNIPNPYTKAELNTYLDAMKEEFPFYFPLFMMLSHTGARFGEGLGLQWRDIHFDRGIIHIERQLVDKDKSFDTPKDGATRKVMLDRYLSETLQGLKAERNGFGDGLVFVNTKGGPIDQGNLRARVHYAVMEKAGLRRIRVHDLRHTYATLMIGEGMDIGRLAKLLGHKDPKITHTIYSHWIPEKDDGFSIGNILNR